MHVLRYSIFQFRPKPSKLAKHILAKHSGKKRAGNEVNFLKGKTARSDIKETFAN